MKKNFGKKKYPKKENEKHKAEVKSWTTENVVCRKCGKKGHYANKCKVRNVQLLEEIDNIDIDQQMKENLINKIINTFKFVNIYWIK